MKVDIGPYPTDWLRCQIYDRYMNKKYGFDWEDNHNKFEKFLEKLDDTIQSVYNATINQVIKHRKRKIKVRIDRHDIWNMNETLAHIIVPMLKQLKESKHGAPFVDDKDVPKHLRSTAAPAKENESDTDDNHFKRWEYVLDEMIFAFEAQLIDWESQFYSGEHDIKSVKVEIDGKTYYEWQKGPNDTFKVDKKNYNLYNKRMKNGYRLFGKYYEGLWN